MQDNYEDFRQNLKYYRDLRGWSQADLAIQTDTSYGQIGNIESGISDPSIELIFKIAEALAIHPADLFLRDASKIKNGELFSKHHKLVENCENLSEQQQKTVCDFVQSLAETEPDYESSVNKIIETDEKH